MKLVLNICFSKYHDHKYIKHKSVKLVLTDSLFSSDAILEYYDSRLLAIWNDPNDPEFDKKSRRWSPRGKYLAINSHHSSSRPKPGFQ